MVGRDRELAQLRGALLAASGGAGRMVLVSGEAGIGKTRLTTALAEIAGEYGVAVARGHAVDDPGMPPLWPWHGVARDVPALGAVLSTAGTALDSASARFAMLADASAALAVAASDAGLVVVVEDLHWADQTSLRLLRHLAGEVARTRLLVVGTFREAGDPVLADLPRTTRSIRLTGLGRPDIARWLRLLAPDVDTDPVADRLAASTGGNPLFVRMVVDRMTDLGSFTSYDLGAHPELRRLVLARVDELPASVKELLGAASVLGEHVDVPLLAAVSGLDTAGLLDQAVAAGVLRVVPDTAELLFSHALVRDAVYEDLPPSQRMALHRRAAQALDATDTNAGLIANHWRRSGAADASVHCVQWMRVAAVAATRALAYDEAVKFATLALANAAADVGDEPRAELTLELAQAEFQAGLVGPSLVHAQEAARLAERTDRTDLLAAAALVNTGMGDPQTLAVTDQLCATALRVIPPGDTALRARLLAQRAIAVADTGDAADKARELSARALELAELSGDPDAILDGIHARHFTLCAPQYLAERIRLGTWAVNLGEAAEQPLAALWGHVWLVDAALQQGNLVALDRELGQIERFATARQHPLAWWHLHRLRATRAALTGDLDQAIAFNETARETAERIGSVGTTGMYYAFLNQLALLRGTLDRTSAEAALVQLRQVPDIALVRIFVPMTHALTGDVEAAKATFEEFRHMPPTLQIGPRWGALIMMIGVVAVLLDDAETAALVYDSVRDLEPDYMTDGTGAVFCAGSSRRPLGDLALTMGLVDAAVRHYQEAVDMNARIGARPFLALSRYGLAKALLAKGATSTGPGVSPPKQPRSSGNWACRPAWPPRTPCSPRSAPPAGPRTRCRPGSPRSPHWSPRPSPTGRSRPSWCCPSGPWRPTSAASCRNWGTPPGPRSPPGEYVVPEPSLTHHLRGPRRCKSDVGSS
ncbi:AAA family ATPase [Kibdelosporangium lantanae]